ncbi:hypothetical protein PILCRDRAFT_813613 [Piloderma croceum F 1598]|uniref:Uncharacterized protein n=1 Tax=Piloderma croceum (strain F 1598) TaxID=765440 RepID=A0A0C3FWX5_PILCF|nr:hypothetical protein PILCRDRAFT_813613 [Piloderma croceum F 1598]
MRASQENLYQQQVREGPCGGKNPVPACSSFYQTSDIGPTSFIELVRRFAFGFVWTVHQFGDSFLGPAYQ